MEYEVYKEAVEIYNQYEVYEDWKLYGEEGKKRPFRSSMYGYYLKSDKFPGCTIVGDILTSNKVWGNDRDNSEIIEELALFESIYHIDGNYIPIPEIRNMRTANLCGKNCDTYTHHLNVCKEAIEGTLKRYKVWQIWAEKIWIPYCNELKRNSWEKFIEDYYLWDFVDGKKQPKSFVGGRTESNQVGIQIQDKEGVIIKTIIDCINLIIMRDYRIKKDIKKDYNFVQSDEYRIYKRELLIERGYEEKENGYFIRVKKL